VPFCAGWGILVTAAVLRRVGDFDGARAALTEADELIGAGYGVFAAEIGLERARLFRAAGEPDQAEETAHASLLTAVEGGFRRVALLAVEELAHLAGVAAATTKRPGCSAPAGACGG
jgi:hypothetical protein